MVRYKDGWTPHYMEYQPVDKAPLYFSFYFGRSLIDSYNSFSICDLRVYDVSVIGIRVCFRNYRLSIYNKCYLKTVLNVPR